MKKKILEFIDMIHKTEKYDEDFYENLEDEYLNGECEKLVLNLAIFTNFAGEKIRIYQNEAVHYVYKLDNLFYDIRGAFSSIEDILEETSYFSKEDIHTAEIDVDNFNDFEANPIIWKSLVFPINLSKFEAILYEKNNILV